MPWILQMLGFCLFLLGIGFALWVSSWLLLFLFGAGVLAVIYTHLRQYLTETGILNPTPGVTPERVDEEEPEEITVIQGDFEHVEAPQEVNPKK